MAGWTAPKQSAESQVGPSLWSEGSATFSPHQQLLSTPYVGDFPPPPSSLSWPRNLCISLSPVYLVCLFSTQKPLSSDRTPHTHAQLTVIRGPRCRCVRPGPVSRRPVSGACLESAGPGHPPSSAASPSNTEPLKLCVSCALFLGLRSAASIPSGTH